MPPGTQLALNAYMTSGHRAERPRRQLLQDATVTLATVLLAFAAFDDITTDNDTSFTFEWAALALCGVWLAIVSWRLFRSEHHWLGGISAIALVATAATGSRIRSITSPFQVEYLTTLAGLLWFLGLAGILTVQAYRRRTNRDAA